MTYGVQGEQSRHLQLSMGPCPSRPDAGALLISSRPSDLPARNCTSWGLNLGSRVPG